VSIQQPLYHQCAVYPTTLPTGIAVNCTNMVINDDRGCAQRMAGWLAARRSRQVCIKGPKGLVPRRGTALNKVHGSRGGPSRADGVVQW